MAAKGRSPETGGGHGRRRRSLLLIVGLALSLLIGFLVLDRSRDRQPGGGDGGGSTTIGTGPVTTEASTAPVPSTTVPERSVPVSTPPSTSKPKPADLRLGGDDLGVTRVGAPSKEAVAAVTAALGRPLADPATDSACIGAQGETAWAGFRLGMTGGKLSGWRSTSTSLSTPAGATVGTTLAALRTAYGAAFTLRPGAEPDEAPVFLVKGTNLGGTLTGPEPTGTVTSLFSGTCSI